tara:strand:+ start:116 stop:754 length:639 start_codon:yes stop_codon:yes gene_type:complete
MNDTPSNAIKELNTSIIKFINETLSNDIIECFNENSNDLYDYIYDHTPSANDYFNYLEQEALFNENYDYEASVIDTNCYYDDNNNDLTIDDMLYILKRIQEYSEGFEIPIKYTKQYIFDMYSMYITAEVLLNDNKQWVEDEVDDEVLEKNIKLKKIIMNMEKQEEYRMEGEPLCNLFTKYFNTLNKQKILIKLLKNTPLTLDLCELITGLSI